MMYNELDVVLRNEKKFPRLSALPSNFFELAVKHINKLKSERAEIDVDSIEFGTLTDEIRASKRILKEVMGIRIMKLFRYIVSGLLVGKCKEIEGLTQDEKEVYNQILEPIRKLSTKYSDLINQ